MPEFQIQIAGQNIHVQSLYESTAFYCRNYLTEHPCHFSVAVTPEDLDREQQLLYREALEEGLRPRVFPEPFLERSVIQRQVADLLLARDILLFHGSTVAVDGQAYLFTAPCGTGKSTHTRLWREVFGDRARMINDDKPFLQFTPEGVLACGAPWSGKHGLDTNLSLPLAGICILRRGTQNQIAPAFPEESRFLFTQGHKPEDAALHSLARDLTARLIGQVPIWHMACTKDPEAARIAWEAMHT